MRYILGLLALIANIAQAQNSPCYWSGQLVKCFPTTGIYLDTGRSLRLGDATTNYVELKAANAVTTYSLTWPPAQGSSGQTISNNGSGILSWATFGPGTVTSVTGTPPIQVATGTTTPVISITQSGVATDGYLSSTDWNTFNNKQAAGAYITALTGDVTATGPGSSTATSVKASDSWFLYNGSDPTKQLLFNLSGGTAAKTMTIASSPTNNRVLTLPDATDTLVGKATTDTLTNKSISGSTNTITNVSLTTGVTGTLPIGNGGTGQTTANAAFGALSPLTTKGDIVGYSTVNARIPVGSDTQVLTADSTQVLGVKWAAPATSGTVTSVALSIPGIFTISGSPVTSSGTLTATPSGTSGGVPYFSSSTALSSSALLASTAIMVGGGAGSAPKTQNANTVVDGSGNVGIGTATPANLLSVGTTSQFQVDSSGNPVKVNNVTTSFPSAQGSVTQFLQNNGSGTLSWQYGANTGVANATTSGAATAFTISDNPIQIFTLTGAGNATLPTTSVPVGYLITLYNRGAFDLTVKSSNGTTITAANAASGSFGDPTIYQGKVILQAINATPTAPSDWLVVSVAEEGTYASTFVPIPTGTGTTSASQTMKWSRYGNDVTLYVPQFTVTCGAVSTSIQANTNISTRLIPASNQGMLVSIKDNNLNLTIPGILLMQNNGTLGIWRDGLLTAYTAAGVCGTSGSLFNVYNFTYLIN